MSSNPLLEDDMEDNMEDTTMHTVNDVVVGDVGNINHISHPLA